MSGKHRSPEANAPAAPRGDKKPRNHRELGQAVFAEVDPIAVARGLLNSESESVKVRALETLVDWAFGPRAAPSCASKEPVRISWNVPRPAREAAAWAKLAESQAQTPSQSQSEPDEPREEP